MVNPSLSEGQRRVLYEYRKDVLEKIDPRLGLQFYPDSEFSWLRPDTVKINLGARREFSARGWLQVGPGKEFDMPIHLLRLAAAADFIYAPFVVEKLAQDLVLPALRAWRDSLKHDGNLCVIIDDQEKRLRLGMPFESHSSSGFVRYGHQLRYLLGEAGFRTILDVDFRIFDLCGRGANHTGFFCFKS